MKIKLTWESYGDSMCFKSSGESYGYDASTMSAVLVDFELRIKEMLDEGDKDVLVSTSTLLYKT